VNEKKVKTFAGGALSRLWAEFTDPGPAGDSLNMLKKYAPALLPAFMGLLFMSVGALVIVLVSRQTIAADKKTYLPLVVGAVFALVGFLLGSFGISSVLRQARGRPRK
jgi:predicted dinucleotide-utilizing enzyme